MSVRALVGLMIAWPMVASAGPFERMDKDGDGKLTREELGPRAHMVARLDKDGDSAISRAEDAAFRKQVRQPFRQEQEASDCRTIADIPYAGTENPRQMLDLVLPVERGDNPLPVVVFIHGGGWRGGDKRAGHSRVLPYVRSGQYAGVSVGYRLSGEAKWPTPIHDCKAAIRWIRANAGQHGLDPDRIGIWGSSAGGHLVAMLGTSADVPAMDGKLGPHTGVSGRVTCVVDFYGPTDFLTMNANTTEGARMDHDSPESPESLLIGGPIQENRDKVATANPITYVSADDSPFLIAHGTRDPLVSFNQSQLLHAALGKMGVTSTLVTVVGGGHGAGFGPEVHALVTRFFAHHLQGKKTGWSDRTVKAENRAPGGRRRGNGR